MNKAEYLQELASLLSDIDDEDRDDALEYFREYFEDAGEENEESVIQELGSPAELAEKIRKDSKTQKPPGKSESQQEYRSIRIAASGVKVVLQASDRFAVEYQLSDRIRINRIETVDSTLYVDCQLIQKCGGLQQERVTVYYPGNAEFETVEAKVKLGSFSVSGIKTEKLDVQNELGNTSADRISAKALYIQNKTGSLRLGGVRGDTAVLLSAAGNLELEDFSFTGNLQASSSCGRVRLARGRAKNIEVKSEMGDAAGNHLEAEGLCSVRSSLGRILLDGMICREFFAEADKGNVSVSHLTAEKMTGSSNLGNLVGEQLKTGCLTAKANCGFVRLAGELKGKNEIKASMGNITVYTSIPREQCSCHMTSKMGSCSVNGVRSNGVSFRGAETVYELSASMGNVSLNFTGGEQ